MSIDTEQRIAAYNALRDARKAMEEMIAEADRTNDTRPVFAKLKKWLPNVAEGEKDMGNVLSTRDPGDHLGELQQIATRMRQLGQRQTDAIAALIERAIAKVSDY